MLSVISNLHLLRDWTEMRKIKRQRKTEEDRGTLCPPSRCHFFVFVWMRICVCVCVCSVPPHSAMWTDIDFSLRGENRHSRPPYLPSLLAQNRWGYFIGSAVEQSSNASYLSERRLLTVPSTFFILFFFGFHVTGIDTSLSSTNYEMLFKRLRWITAHGCENVLWTPEEEQLHEIKNQ